MIIIVLVLCIYFSYLLWCFIVNNFEFFCDDKLFYEQGMNPEKYWYVPEDIEDVDF